MNKKSVMGLILFGFLTTVSLFIGVHILIGNDVTGDAKEKPYVAEEITNGNDTSSYSLGKEQGSTSNIEIDITKEEPWLTANPYDKGNGFDPSDFSKREEEQLTPRVAKKSTNSAEEQISNTFSSTVKNDSEIELIYDSRHVDYMSYIPATTCDSRMEEALDIPNPSLNIKAKSAILINAKTGDILYHKNAIDPVFPASTSKLLTSLVALDWCYEDEEVTVGEEVKMMAWDSTRAYLREGQTLTIGTLIDAMLLPSGNDAAYVTAVYVGRKSLQKPGATKEEAVLEFSKLMNRKAKELGVMNSKFLTPDGYDAIGQFTTAYDMGMIGLAAIKNDIIVESSMKAVSRSIFISGEDRTWTNTNALIKKNDHRYYAYAVGLKTGTSTMAGRCIVAAGRKNGKEVICVVMNSTSDGRWADAKTLLEYGLR